ncbi:MAG TPA: ATP-binding protein, partial [Nannocystaceae bacterium]|nr:ATP-binding protein [Nannocystaceae bacterium]
MIEPPSSVDEVLARLVAQFASPYDFLRELVQNAMDAGSDRVEVLLHMHEDGERVVFELEIVDAGEGMDEQILDGELTKLFASTKAGDRTQAGGFGIGFVSVFAWSPQAVLLHTARAGETWELVFDEDRRFEKHAVDAPFEGTTVRLFRRGAAAERESIAESVRQSLWRWCRFVPLEITFEDVAAGSGPEPIRDSPPASDEALLAVHEQGETRVRVAFAVPPHAVLLRHGLVLAEGMPGEHLPHVAAGLGDSLEHLRVWADSPLLRTDLARDHVIDDDGRKQIERIVERLVAGLREESIARLEALVATTGAWSAELHTSYAYLHAHLACERKAIGARIRERALVRLATGGSSTIAALVRRARSGLVLACDPGERDADALVLQSAA